MIENYDHKIPVTFYHKEITCEWKLENFGEKNMCRKKGCCELILALLLLVNSLVVHAYSDGFYYLRCKAAIQEIFCLVSCSLKKLVPKMLDFVEWALATFSCL